MDVYFTNLADREFKDWLKSNKADDKKIYELISDIKEFGVLGGRGKPEQTGATKGVNNYAGK